MSTRTIVSDVLAFFLVSSLVLGGCSSLGEDSRESEREAFRDLIREQRQVWAENGFDSYRYRYQVARSGGGVDVITVEVRGGTVAEASTPQGGPIRNPEDRRTIRDLFGVARQVVDQDKDRFTIRFDQEQGYLRLLVANFSDGGTVQYQVFKDSLQEIEEEETAGIAR